MTAQSAFRAALLDASAPIPGGLGDGAGNPAGRRFDVYRNNVAVSLRDALEAGFPAIARLLGPENFHHVAGLYLRQSPPDSPILARYGAGFADFLARLNALAHLPYLSDVAQIDYALRLAYHAADSRPADAACLAERDAADLMAAHLTLAPSVQILRSHWPALSIWTYTMRPGTPKPQAGPQDCVILRRDYDPEPHPLAPGGAAFLLEIARGASLGDALDRAGENFDIAAVLSLLLAHNAITHISI